MTHWQQYLKSDPIPWLLETDDPSITYHTLRNLMDKSEDDLEVIDARKRISGSQHVKQLLEGQTDDGYWGNPAGYLNDRFTGTAWRVLLLLELGIDPAHSQVQRAAKFLIDQTFNPNLQGFVSRQVKPTVVPCYSGDLLWLFFRCGLADHQYALSGLDWLVNHMVFNDGDEDVENPDDGCFGRHTCIRAVFPVLRACSSLPEHLKNERTDQLIQGCIEFILLHRVYKRSHDVTKNISPKLMQLTFPCFYYPDFLYALFLLTEFNVKDDRMEDALASLLKKQDKNGRWKMQRLYNERSKNDLFPVATQLEERGQPSRWVTLRALTVIKRFYSIL